METKSLKKFFNSKAIDKIALRNYETYVEHYKKRKLIPMPLNDFLKNYNR